MTMASSHDIFHDTFADDFLEFSSFGWLDDMLVEVEFHDWRFFA